MRRIIASLAAAMAAFVLHIGPAAAATPHRPPTLAQLGIHLVNGHPVNALGFVLDGSAQLDDLHCVGTNREIGQCMAARRGWTGQQWLCLDHRWGAIESGWSTSAYNPDDSMGIPQAHPGEKMAGPNYVEIVGGGYVGNWRTDPWIQIAWGLHYIATSRWRTPCGTPWTGGY